MVTDPTLLYRVRDGVYAPDLLIVAVTDLDICTRLARTGPSTAADLARTLDLSEAKVDVLLTYLAALELLDRAADTVSITQLAADHFVEGAPFDLRPYYASLRERPGCGELLSVLRTGEPAGWSSAPAGDDWVARLSDPEFAGRITAAMDARGRFLGPLLADVVGGLGVRRVLDVGGSSGVYAAAIAERLPAVTAAVFERPPVDTAARALIAARGSRVDVLAGDMFAGLPAGFDLHLYSHVLHDWDADRVRALIAASFAALDPGGYFVDHDVHVNRAKTGPLPAAEYSVFLMHSTPGKCWSVGELESMLADAGFDWIGERPTGGDRSAVVARKPV